MPAILALVGFMTSAAFFRFAAKAVLVGAGFALFQIVGLDVFFGDLEAFVRSAITGLPADILNFVGIMNLDLYINWVFLGFAVWVAMKIVKRLVPGR